MRSMDWAWLRGFAIALFIGALVGTERTHHQQEETDSFAGLRTFMLLAELGAVLTWFGTVLDTVWLFIGGLVAVALLLIAVHVGDAQRQRPERVGTTTATAAMVVYALGGVALREPRLAVALAIATSGLLALKQPLHRAIARISHEELLATLRLLFASFIILPLLPNRPLDPWGALNPYKLWLLVILISALSMVGYVAGRLLGAARGTLVTGFFGGIVSSTAVTLTLAKQSREPGASTSALTTGVLVAWSVMFVRVIALIGMLSWRDLGRTAVPLGIMAIAALGGGLLVLRGRLAQSGRETSTALNLKNPFRIVSAVKFALLFGVVLLVSKLTQQLAPAGGLYWVSAIAGSTDVDAILLSLLEMRHAQDIPSLLVARCIVIAGATNTLIKLLMLFALASRGLARSLVPTTMAVLLAAAGAVAFLR